MNNIKFLKSILLVLLLVNIATLSFLWLTKPPRNNRQGSAKDFFSHELSFSAKQEQQFDSLKDLFQAQKEDLRDEVKDKYKNYFDLLQNPKVDSSTVKNVVSEIIRIKEKEELTLFYHFQKVRSICDATQKQKFDRIVKEAAQMIGPGSQGERCPPPREDRQDAPPPPEMINGQGLSPRR
jgi:Spy/CpxP family protein refolding chaperone